MKWVSSREKLLLQTKLVTAAAVHHLIRKVGELQGRHSAAEVVLRNIGVWLSLVRARVLGTRGRGFESLYPN